MDIAIPWNLLPFQRQRDRMEECFYPGGSFDRTVALASPPGSIPPPLDRGNRRFEPDRWRPRGVMQMSGGHAAAGTAAVDR
jgi:hypothetical protein